MDPDKCLEEMLELAGKVVDDKSCGNAEDVVLDLSHLVLALHDWIRGGGFLPKEWRR